VGEPSSQKGRKQLRVPLSSWALPPVGSRSRPKRLDLNHHTLPIFTSRKAAAGEEASPCPVLRGAARRVAGISRLPGGGERLLVRFGRGVRSCVIGSAAAWDLGGVGRVGQAGVAAHGKVAREKDLLVIFCGCGTIPCHTHRLSSVCVVFPRPFTLSFQ
jgi:hypothetical protein